MKKLIRRAFRRINSQLIKDEKTVHDAVFIDSANVKDEIEHLYEELNIIDRKLVQLSTLNAGLMIAGGVFFRSIPVTIDYAKAISSWLSDAVVIIFSASFSASAVAALLAAVPGLVSAGSISSRILSDVKKAGISSAAVEVKEYPKACITELLEVKLLRNKRYYQSVLTTIVAVVLLIASILLSAYCFLSA